MNERDLDEHKKDLIELASQWRLGLIDKEGFARLNCWYTALAGEPLGQPDGLTVEKLELWLHRQVFRPQPSDAAALQALWASMNKGK